jgi:hypothetical protein
MRDCICQAHPSCRCPRVNRFGSGSTTGASRQLSVARSFLTFLKDWTTASQSARVHPVGEQGGPYGEHPVRHGKTEAVPALGENMQFSRNMCCPKRIVVSRCVGRRDQLIRGGVKNKSRRSVCLYIFRRGDLNATFFIWRRPGKTLTCTAFPQVHWRITENGEIRTAAQPLDRVGGLRVAGIE